MPSSGEGLCSRQREVQKPRGTNKFGVFEEPQENQGGCNGMQGEERGRGGGWRQAGPWEQGLTRKESGSVLGDMGSVTG